MRKKILVFLSLTVLLLSFVFAGCSKGKVSNVKPINDLSEYYQTRQYSTFVAIEKADGDRSLLFYDNGVAVFDKGEKQIGVFVDLNVSIEGDAVNLLRYGFNQTDFCGLIVKNGVTDDFYDALGNKFASQTPFTLTTAGNFLIINDSYYRINADGSIKLEENATFDTNIDLSEGREISGRYYLHTKDTKYGVAVYDEFAKLVGTYTCPSYKTLYWDVLSDGNLLVQLKTVLESTSGNYSYLDYFGNKIKIETLIFNPDTKEIKELDYHFVIVKLFNNKITAEFEYDKAFTENAPNYALVLPFEDGTLQDDAKRNADSFIGVIIDNDGKLKAKSDIILEKVATAYNSTLGEDDSFIVKAFAPLDSETWLMQDAFQMMKIINDENEVITQGKGSAFYDEYVNKIEIGYKIVQEEGKYCLYVNGEKKLSCAEQITAQRYGMDVIVSYQENSTQKYALIKNA